jgi:hypothetical protein
MGIEIIIKNLEDELVNEVKKVGLLRDRNARVELRLGDTLIVYVTNDSIDYD